MATPVRRAIKSQASIGRSRGRLRAVPSSLTGTLTRPNDRREHAFLTAWHSNRLQLLHGVRSRVRATAGGTGSLVALPFQTPPGKEQALQQSLASVFVGLVAKMWP